MDSPAPAIPRPKAPGRTDIAITEAVTHKKERRWWVVALCVVLAVVCALAASAAVTAAGDRVKVVAVARDVPAGQALAKGDLRVAEVSADSALTPVDASRLTALLGKRPAVDLRQGGLLTESQLATGTGLGDDRQLVGIQVKKGQAPAGALSPGDRVLAVTTPAQGDQGADEDEAPATVKGSVVSVSRPDATGTVVVNIAVDGGQGPQLATRAAVGRVALVREPRDS
ncbi:SAF domain-containing protein [Streptomyces sp. NRRL F-5630]|uniref:SAF domain-containing protein n=1 Tax=Streptomyces sp. NRRL F-5630 TaxID=1463864 RepID=UPI003D740007